MLTATCSLQCWCAGVVVSGIALALSLCLRDSVPLTDTLKQAVRKVPQEEEEPLVQASFVICHDTRQHAQSSWKELLKSKPACSEQVTVCICISGSHQWRLPELR